MLRLFFYILKSAAPMSIPSVARIATCPPTASLDPAPRFNKKRPAGLRETKVASGVLSGPVNRRRHTHYPVVIHPAALSARRPEVASDRALLIVANACPCRAQTSSCYYLCSTSSEPPPYNISILNTPFDCASFVFPCALNPTIRTSKLP